MNIFILVIVFAGAHGAAISSTEFSSETACNNAKNLLLQELGQKRSPGYLGDTMLTYNTTALCVAKDVAP